MQRTNYLAFAVIFGGIAVLLTGAAQSQTSVFKNFVGLQASTPGTTQAGHANLSGTMRAGQFAGDGAGLTNLNADQLTAGILDDARLTGNVAMRNQPNTFALPNYFLGNFVGVGRTNQVTGSEVFGIGNNNPSFAGMYVRTAPQGLPFYGYSLGGNISAYHYVDGSDGNKWKFYQGTGIHMVLDTQGNLGLGTDTLTSRLNVAGSGVAATFSSSGGVVLSSLANASGAKAMVAASNAETGNGVGIEATSSSTDGYGVIGRAWGQGAGTNFGGYFEGYSQSSIGIYGRGQSRGGYFQSLGFEGAAVYAEAVPISSNTVGVHGVSRSNTGVAVLGEATGTAFDTNYGVRGESLSVGGFGVFATGRFGASGTKSFRIDHPFDPLNKYLLHYSSESPMPQNFYNGNVTTDASGYAWVELPDYFEEINTNFKYQLTVVDDEDLDNFVLAKVSKTIRGNRFQIRTSEPNVTVSWEVKADRNDLWVRKAKPRDVEEKVGHEKGRYQHPDLYGLPPGNAVK